MTASDLVIRKATLTDIGALLDLEERGFRLDLFDRRQYRYLIAKAQSTVFAAEISGRVAGAAVMLWRKKSKAGRLYNIVVDPRAHGQGIGASLLNECEKEAMRRGFNAVTLEVRVDNDKAISFYLNRGYERIGKIPFYYSDNKAALKMKKRLR